MTATGTPWTFHQDQFWMRGEEPPGRVVHDEAKGLWNIYGWDESLQALGDPETFSSDLSVLAPEGKRQIFPGNLTTMDPPDHTKLRKIVSGVFTRGMVAALEPRIKELTLELLAGTEPGSSFDLVEELAHPCPSSSSPNCSAYPARTAICSANGSPSCWPTTRASPPARTPRAARPAGADVRADREPLVLSARARREPHG